MTVLVLVPGATLVVDSAGAGDVVSVTVAGGTAVVVTVEVEVEVDTEVLVVLAGLSTPQAMRWSEVASWCSRIAEPPGPLSWSSVKPSLVATSLPAPSERTSRGGRSPLAGSPVRPGAWKWSPADMKSPSHVPTAWMCRPCKPGERIPVPMVSTVTVAYPLVKSIVASATGSPSVDFSWVVSVCAPDADPEVVVVDELSEDSFAQPLKMVTGAANKAMAAVACLIMRRTYPCGGGDKPRVRWLLPKAKTPLRRDR